jgi:hypothetical protein
MARKQDAVYLLINSNEKARYLITGLSINMAINNFY